MANSAALCCLIILICLMVMLLNRDELSLSFFMLRLSRRIVTAVIYVLYDVFIFSQPRSDGRQVIDHYGPLTWTQLTPLCVHCVHYTSHRFKYFIYLLFFWCHLSILASDPFDYSSWWKRKSSGRRRLSSQTPYSSYIYLSIYLIFIELLHQ